MRMFFITWNYDSNINYVNYLMADAFQPHLHHA